MKTIIIFQLFIYIFWLPHIIRRLFYQLYMWQIKEYRYDRMMAYLKESKFKSLLSLPTLLSFILSVSGLLLLKFIHIRYLYFIILIGFSYYVYSTLSTFTGFLCKKNKCPKKSLRNALMVFGLLIFSFIPIILSTYFYSSIYKTNEVQVVDTSQTASLNVFPEKQESGLIYISLETAVVVIFFCMLYIFDLILPIITFILVKFTSIFVFFYRKRKIKQAKKKIKQIENLKVIGITGSYGKTTVKELTHLILSRNYKTYSTPGNVNSDIGVANTILSNMSFIADVFIVEMGAYKKGEIKSICDIAKPDIAIVTAISEQHLALFKSIENTLRAKYEIVENSKSDAVIVINGDSELALRIAGKSSKKEILYSVRKEMDIFASDIKSEGESLEFNVHYKEKIQRFEVKILGEHNVSNILAATSVCLSLGMKLDEISKALKDGSETKHIGKLRVRLSRFGYKVLDDSYNSNSNGFLAALDVLDNMKGKKKIIVTIGVIELGPLREQTYSKLAEKIIKTCDTLVTSDKKLMDTVKRIDKNFEVIFDRGISKQLEYLKKDVSSNDVVLFEGPNIRLIQEIVK